jgi:hypothetical protein
MSRRVAFSSIVVVAALTAGFACNDILGIRAPSESPDGGGGTGAPSGAAGTRGTGGAGGSAGTGAKGGTAGSHTAGTTGAGNTTGRAGTTGTGNVTGQAGTTGTGNVTGQAGTTGTGNVTGQAGTTGTGNVTGQAGTTGTAPTCGASFAVESTGFVTMPSKAGTCWSGYAYTNVDTYGSTASPASPTPGFSTCGSPCSLTLTGNILAVTGTNYSFEGLGFALGQISGGTANAEVAPTGTGLTIAFTNTTPPSFPLRAQITDGTTTWCYTVTGGSPATIPYASFNTKCYDSPPDGTVYAKNPINAIQLQIAGGTTSGAVKVTIMSVTEN